MPARVFRAQGSHSIPSLWKGRQDKMLVDIVHGSGHVPEPKIQVGGSLQIWWNILFGKTQRAKPWPGSSVG